MEENTSAKQVDQLNNSDNVVVVREVTPQITTVSIPFTQFGVLKTGGRMTLVRLHSGALVVISPTALTAFSRRIVASLGGQVRYIIAPNLEHYLHVADWKAEYPNACLIAPEGLPEKCKSKPAFRDVQFDTIITGPTSIAREFDQEFSIEYVDAMASQDIVLLHKPTSTLIEADLLFNAPAQEQFSKSDISPTSGFLNKLITLRVFSTEAPATWQKRLAWHVLGAKDRPKFRGSVENIYGWDFDRIIPCHGDVIESGGKEVFAEIFGWYFLDKKS